MFAWIKRDVYGSDWSGYCFKDMIDISLGVNLNRNIPLNFNGGCQEPNLQQNVTLFHRQCHKQVGKQLYNIFFFFKKKKNPIIARI